MEDKILPGLPATPARFPAHLVTLLCQRRLSLHARQNDNGDSCHYAILVMCMQENGEDWKGSRRAMFWGRMSSYLGLHWSWGFSAAFLILPRSLWIRSLLCNRNSVHITSEAASCKDKRGAFRKRLPKLHPQDSPALYLICSQLSRPPRKDAYRQIKGSSVDSLEIAKCTVKF